MTPALHSAEDLLRVARQALADAGKATPALDARLLLQAAARIGHEALIADPTRVIGPEAAGRFSDLLERRLAGEPVARLLGEREFYGRAFTITRATLDPRPATETLVEAALCLMPQKQACHVADLGTGSGIIGVTLLAERPLATAMMTDISAEALAVARDNARRHGILSRSTLVRSHWLEGVEGRFDLIVSNPPYIAQAILPTLEPEVRNFDPEMALVGGPDGLQAYREIAAGAAPFLVTNGLVLVEIGEGQAAEITFIFEEQGWQPEGRWHDLAGHVRCLGFRACGTATKKGLETAGGRATLDAVLRSARCD